MKTRFLLLFVLASVTFCQSAHASSESFNADQMKSIIAIREAYAALDVERMTAFARKFDRPPIREHWQKFFAELTEKNMFLSRFEIRKRPDGEVQIEMGFSHLSDEGCQSETLTSKIFGSLTATEIRLYSF